MFLPESESAAGEFDANDECRLVNARHADAFHYQRQAVHKGAGRK